MELRYPQMTQYIGLLRENFQQVVGPGSEESLFSLMFIVYRPTEMGYLPLTVAPLAKVTGF